MYLAINKHNPNEYHSFTYSEEGELIINWLKVKADDWRIIEVFEDQGPAIDSAGFTEADRYGDDEDECSHHCDDPNCNCSI